MLITQKPHRKCPCHPLKRFTSLPPQIKGVVWKHFALDKGIKINIICGCVSPISWPCVRRCLCLSVFSLLPHSLFPFSFSCFFSSKVCFWRKQHGGNRLSLVVAFSRLSVILLADNMLQFGLIVQQWVKWSVMLLPDTHLSVNSKLLPSFCYSASSTLEGVNIQNCETSESKAFCFGFYLNEVARDLVMQSSQVLFLFLVKWGLYNT